MKLPIVRAGIGVLALSSAVAIGTAGFLSSHPKDVEATVVNPCEKFCARRDRHGHCDDWDWRLCHHNPAQSITLEFNNEHSCHNHVGTPHSNGAYDTYGRCPSVTPTSTIQPTPTPTETVMPTPTPEPEATPTPDPEVTPTNTPVPTSPPNIGGPGDGLSDGRSDGLSSCPECTAAPQGDVLGAQSGQVLGASTLAATGSASDGMFALGLLSLIASIPAYVAKKRFV